MNTTNKKEQMWESLQDPEYRKQVIDEHINVGIAFQIHGLRLRQELSQKALAEQLGIKQPLISAWENPNYGKYTLNTLKELAKAFDVGLLVRFVPFSTLINWSVDLTGDAIAPPSFQEEKPNFSAKFSAESSSTDATGEDADLYPDIGTHRVGEHVVWGAASSNNLFQDFSGKNAKGVAYAAGRIIPAIA
jgi:transcriptional regulator with XRE-family HTH domain